MMRVEEIMDLVSFLLRVADPVLMIIIICMSFYSLRCGRRDERVLIALDDEERKIRYPVLFWENSLGRSRSSDIRIDDPTVSRDHAVLLRRESGWFVADTGSKAGVYVNGQKTEGRCPVYVGDKITLGTSELILKRADDPTTAYQRRKIKKPKQRDTVSGSLILSLITVHVFMLTVQCYINMGNVDTAVYSAGLIFAMWMFYALSKKLFKRKSFEIESLAILLSGTSVILTAAHDAKDAMVQLIAMVLGMCVFCFMIWFIEIPDRVRKWRLTIYILTIGLLAITIVLGRNVNGAKNWIILGPISVQPSEFAKVAYIFVGAATLDQLQTKKNLFGFIFVTAICIGLLFFMSDFGTALIFFVTFLVIAFMRSGDFRTIILAVAAAVLGVMLILSIKPYIADRFQAWGHVWEYASTSGYQQVNTFIYSASGGLFGVGIAKGYLQYVFASESDLVFGLACEELGLLTALLFGVVIGGFMIYARAMATRSRSTFYSIAACSAGGLLVFQATLNIFGVVDLLPLTGVTLPFVSCGGTSMIGCWGLLAFIKAADERTYSSRKKQKSGLNKNTSFTGKKFKKKEPEVTEVTDQNYVDV